MEDVLLYFAGSTRDVSAQGWTRLPQEPGELTLLDNLGHCWPCFSSSPTTFTMPSGFITRWRRKQMTTQKSSTSSDCRHQTSPIIFSRHQTARNCSLGSIQSTSFVPHSRRRHSKVIVVHSHKLDLSKFLGTLQAALEVKNDFSVHYCHARRRNLCLWVQISNSHNPIFFKIYFHSAINSRRTKNRWPSWKTRLLITSVSQCQRRD